MNYTYFCFTLKQIIESITKNKFKNLKLIVDKTRTFDKGNRIFRFEIINKNNKSNFRYNITFSNKNGLINCNFCLKDSYFVLSSISHNLEFEYGYIFDINEFNHDCYMKIRNVILKGLYYLMIL